MATDDERSCVRCGFVPPGPQPVFTLIDRRAGASTGEAWDFCSVECLTLAVTPAANKSNLQCACLCRKCGGGVAHCGRVYRACNEKGTGKDVRQ